MKKLFTLLTGFLLSVKIFAALAPGSNAPDWTLTDLNGNSWNLYALTAQGKTVFIDVSATWCPPCWSYHNSHALRDVYDAYGPNGTVTPNQVMVFFIEDDNATDIADLYGTGSNTLGNWVSGITYPIIDAGSNTTQFHFDYDITYYPTIYKICPDNKVYEVGSQNTQGLLNTIGSCPSVLPDAYSTAGPNSSNCVNTFSPQITLYNNMISGNLNSCSISYAYDGGGASVFNWTGSIAAGASGQACLPSNTFTSGNHYVSIAVSNANGSGNGNVFNDSATYNFTVNSAVGVAVPLLNDMSNTIFPYSNWTVDNPDNGMTWTYNWVNGGSLWMNCYSYNASGAIDDFIIEPVDLSSVSTASLQFNVAHWNAAQAVDGLEVLVSPDCGLTWNSVWAKSGTTLSTVPGYNNNIFQPTSGQWRAECINLNAFAGQSKLFIKFRCTNGNGNCIYVDDINVSSATCQTSVSESEIPFSNLNVYPNPTDALANFSFELKKTSFVSLSVYNVLGEIVHVEEKGELTPGDRVVSVNTESLSDGIYLVELRTGEHVTVSKMNVKH